MKFITASVAMTYSSAAHWILQLRFLCVSHEEKTDESSNNRSFWYVSFWQNCTSLLCDGEEKRQSKNCGTLSTQTRRKRCFAITGLLTQDEKNIYLHEKSSLTEKLPTLVENNNLEACRHPEGLIFYSSVNRLFTRINYILADANLTW